MYVQFFPLENQTFIILVGVTLIFFFFFFNLRFVDEGHPTFLLAINIFSGLRKYFVRLDFDTFAL